MQPACPLLQSLIRLPSVNPMGQAVSPEPDHYYEHRVTAFLESFFRDLQVPWQRQTVAPLQDNILARIDSPNPSAPVLLYEVHQDTVPVEGMTIEPFGGELRDGRVYGRGACDVKGSMASMLVAFAELARTRPPTMATVVLACTVNEESGFTGATALQELWNACQGDSPEPQPPGSSTDSQLLTAPPDAVVVAEPTMLNVVVAHKGVLRWRCHAHGRAAHSSRPEEGENAIYLMSDVIQALRRHHADLTRDTRHPLLGTSTLSVDVIRGGQSVNVVPDACLVEIDRRLLPQETPEQAWRAAQDAIQTHLGDERGQRVTHDEPFTVAQGLADDLNGDLASRLQRCLAQRNLPGGERIGVPFGTDAQVYGQSCPTVVFGPGSIDQAHTKDEWIEVEQLEMASRVYYDLAAHWSPS